jgi:hypothetical protein
MARGSGRLSSPIVHGNWAVSTIALKTRLEEMRLELETYV